MSNIYAIDFGTGKALQIWGPDGVVPKASLNLPRVRGGKTPSDEFTLPLRALLMIGDVVVESPTIGSSGAEIAAVKEIIADAPNKLYTVSARAVKNYRRDNGLRWAKGARYAKDGAPPPVMLELHEQESVHVEDAEIIWRIAQNPLRLRVWHVATPAPRMYTSVRPSDKRGYRDERSDEFMANLPPYEALPTDIAAVLGVKGKYSRSMAMPFAMALGEDFLYAGDRDDIRKRWEKIIGLYEHGYPSFYRRAVIVWMQENAKLLSGASRMEEVTPDVRKQAWRTTTKQVRQLLHLSLEHIGYGR